MKSLQKPVCQLSLAFALSLFTATVLAAERSAPPRLILQITVDQLRGDLPSRYYDRLGKGGLRYLLDKGLVLVIPSFF